MTIKSLNKITFSTTDHLRQPKLRGKRGVMPWLVLDGVELDGYDNLGTYYHVLAIGASLKPPLLTRNFLKTLRIAYSQGAVLIWKRCVIYAIKSGKK